MYRHLLSSAPMTPTYHPEESAKRLNALGKSNLRIEIYEGSGHALQDPVGRGNSIIREEALAAIRSTIKPD